MSVIVSTGFASRILGPHSFESIFLNGCIEIRTGPQPISADDAPTGALLGRITANGGAWVPGVATNGLHWSRTGRYATKDPAQAWVLKGSATQGAAGWFRILPNAADAGTYSETAPRIDGAIGLISDELGDAQLRLPLIDLTASTAIEVSTFLYAIPPL